MDSSTKYSNPPQPPPLFTDTADSILATVHALLARHRAVLNTIAARVTPATATFDTVLRPILLCENDADTRKWVCGFYQLASPHADLRDASRTAEGLMDGFDAECGARGDIFALVDAAYRRMRGGEAQGLDGESMRLLEKERRKGRVLDEDTGGVWFRPAELEGIPEYDVEPGELEQGTGENEGKVKVTFKYDHMVPLYKYAVHEATRRTYMLAAVNRANENAPVFQKIIQLRDEAARLVGFPSHAAFKISTCMAKTPDRVRAMLHNIRDLTEDGVKADVAALLEYKRQDCEERGAAFDGRLYVWDKLFYSRVRRSREFCVDELAASQYFPVEWTFEAMLRVFEELFGFVFVKLTHEDRARLSPTGKSGDLAWHPDATIYSVWDDDDEAGGGFRGYLYLDLHSRDNKYSHDACFTLQSGFAMEDSREFYPSAVLLCNLPKPSAAKPALLKHDDVVTVFHELGHAIHTLAARSTYARARDVEPDFLEAPSQMLEHWCWDPSVLRRLSRHWDTGETISEEMVRGLVAAKNMNAALAAREAVHTALFDLVVHSGESLAHVAAMQCGRIWNELRTELTGLHGPEGMGMEWGHGYLTVDHFITGYDAGYYGYLFSEVFSADMFYSAFKDDPMNKEQGRRYRRVVLERGGTMDEMEYLTEFLGREPNAEAFFQDRGLA